MSDIIKMLDLDSRLRKKLSREITLTKNVHSPVMLRSEEESSEDWLFLRKCIIPSLSEGIICITLRSTIGMKRDIEIFLLTAVLVSELKKVILSLSENADH